MCDFPSWLADDNGYVHFLRDKDVIAITGGYLTPEEWADWVGHHAITSVIPISSLVRRKEGFPCPPAIATAIRRGEMTHLMRGGGYEEIHLSAEGNLHREDGPAVVYTNGHSAWYRNGKLHRKDGPAIEFNGHNEWYRNGHFEGCGKTCPWVKDGE